MKLFIADDSEIVQDRLIKLLSEIKNLEILGTAKNSVEAINLIKKLNPDLIITDIRMPGGGGIELIKSVKTDFPEIILIVYTNYHYPEYEERCTELGADYFFRKASQSKELFETVQNLCNRRKSCTAE